MGVLLVEAVDEAIEAALLLQEVLAAGRVVSFFSVRCILSWWPFCSGCPGLMRSRRMPRRSHQTENLLKPKKAPPLAQG